MQSTCRVPLALVACLLFGAAACQKQSAPAAPGPGARAAGEQAAAGPGRTAEQEQPAGDPAPSDGAKPTAEAAPAGTQKLTVYSGRGAVLVEPLFKQFTQKTGIQVDVRFGQTEPLANQLSTERDQSPADLFFAQESGFLGFLGKAGLLAELPKSVLERVPAELRDPEGRWVGTSGRLRVLVYDPKTVKPEDLPKTLEALADPKWKGKLGWAPDNASFQAHITALRHLWGEDKTRAWLEAMIALEPRSYPKNSPQVQAAANGEIAIGWVNHYYLHKLKASNPELAAANYSFSTPGDAGNLIMLAGVGVPKASKQPLLAHRLIEFLLSDEAQAYFVEKDFEYPVRASVAPHPGVPALGDSVVKVDQQHLIDIAPTLALLRELKLQ